MTDEIELDVLFETENYFLQCAEHYDVRDLKKNMDGPYQVVNKLTNLVEYGSHILPGAMEMLFRYEQAYRAFNKALTELNAENPPEVRKVDEPDRTSTNDRTLSILEKVRANPKPVDMDAYRMLKEEDDDKRTH